MWASSLEKNHKWHLTYLQFDGIFWCNWKLLAYNLPDHNCAVMIIFQNISGGKKKKGIMCNYDLSFVSSIQVFCSLQQLPSNIFGHQKFNCSPLPTKYINQIQDIYLIVWNYYIMWLWRNLLMSVAHLVRLGNC